jgi:hypothetical protein
MGKSKGLTMIYNKNMRVKFYKGALGSEAPTEELELLDTFELDDLKDQYESAFKSAEAAAEREKKKAEKETEKKKNETDGNSTSSSDSTKEDSEEAGSSDKLGKPKLKLSVLLSRSGYIQIKTATVGSIHVNYESIKKPVLLTKDNI